VCPYFEDGVVEYELGTNDLPQALQKHRQDLYRTTHLLIPPVNSFMS
jgi:hypothetical protein